MTTPIDTQEVTESPQEAANHNDVTPAPESPENASESTTEAQEETFSRVYVEELRAESAKHRTNAKRSDELASRLVSAYVETGGRLHDPRDLPFSDDLTGEDGFPDPAKVTSAVETLIEAKPHLAKIRPVGDVGQGSVSESSTSDLSAFGSFLRN